MKQIHRDKEDNHSRHHSPDFEASSTPNVIRLEVTGKLTKEDYETFVPELEKWISLHRKIRILFEMIDFHGWTLSAGWEDTKLAFKHYSDIERLILVGDSAWEKEWRSSANLSRLTK